MIDKKFINWRMAVRESTELTSTQKLICFVLNTYMNDGHDVAWPAASTLAGQCSLSRQTVMRQLSELVKMGWLIREQVFDNVKGQRPSKYQINLPEGVSEIIQGCRSETPPHVSSETGVCTQSDTNSPLNSPLNRKPYKGKSSRFVPPSLEEVSDYCSERANHIDPEEFINHYEANGWMRGKSKIKDWKACVRTWEKSREKNRSVHNRRAEQSEDNLARARAAAQRLGGRVVPENGGDIREEVVRPIPKQ